MKVVHRVLDPGDSAHAFKRACALAVMTKAPRAGQVKTRLTPPLTPDEAAALNICFLRDTTAAISEAAANGLARGIAVYTPVGAEEAYAEILPEAFELVPQRGDAFGDRLAFATEDILSLGFESACLIDSDSPTVPPHVFAEAAAILARPDGTIVLGPSDDGGYYLIGLKNLYRSLFTEIDWSTERVLNQTIERAGQLGLKVHLLPAWYDVDDHATLRRLCEEFFGPNGSSPRGYPAPATRSYLDDLLQREGRDRIWPNEQS
jgi:rSAM/selenodomain-associated transferase 1